VTDLYYPLQSLREGHWFKLICGASFQHLPAVRTLSLAYTLAGVDCIDVAADPAVIAAVQDAFSVAANLATAARRNGVGRRGLPWLMVSLNDGEDPHFRKAEFNAVACPVDCSRPCEAICPAQAIVFRTPLSTSATSALRTNAAEQPDFSGVISDRCYGCGRCLPICPVQNISTRSYLSPPTAIAPLVMQAGVDAIEIHTQVGRLQEFRRLWSAIAPWLPDLKLIAISCPDGDGLIEYLWALHDLMQPLPCALIWQTDGRPMCGDIGAGATKAAIALGQKVLAAKLPGYIQLAGGTNATTVPKLSALGLLQPHRCCDRGFPDSISSKKSGVCIPSPESSYIAGVAYGSYARVLLAPILEQLDAGMGQEDSNRLEDVPTLLWQAVELAHSLVAPIKSSDHTIHRSHLFQ